MNLYGVMLYDDLSDFPAPDTYVYLTRDAAQRRADRRTYEYAGVKYWATVHEIKCGWDTSTFGPWPDGPNADWLRWVRFAQNLRLECDRAMNESVELRKLCLDMLRWMPCVRPCMTCERYRRLDGCTFAIRGRRLGIEGEG